MQHLGVGATTFGGLHLLSAPTTFLRQKKYQRAAGLQQNVADDQGAMSNVKLFPTAQVLCACTRVSFLIFNLFNMIQSDSNSSIKANIRIRCEHPFRAHTGN